ALHELGHWTGHPDRLDRELGRHPKGTSEYAREELRAEIYSMMAGWEMGLVFDDQEHLSYLEMYLKVLKKDKKEVFRATKDAQAILDLVFDRHPTLVLENGRAIARPAPLEAMGICANLVVPADAGREEEVAAAPLPVSDGGIKAEPQNTGDGQTVGGGAAAMQKQYSEIQGSHHRWLRVAHGDLSALLAQGMSVESPQTRITPRWVYLDEAGSDAERFRMAAGKRGWTLTDAVLITDHEDRLLDAPPYVSHWLGHTVADGNRYRLHDGAMVVVAAVRGNDVVLETDAGKRYGAPLHNFFAYVAAPVEAGRAPVLKGALPGPQPFGL
nr:zincin-like metallopeptidase domain-containing protein [Pseudomonadota bacterium]